MHTYSTSMSTMNRPKNRYSNIVACKFVMYGVAEDLNVSVIKPAFLTSQSCTSELRDSPGHGHCLSTCTSSLRHEMKLKCTPTWCIICSYMLRVQLLLCYCLVLKSGQVRSSRLSQHMPHNVNRSGSRKIRTALFRFSRSFILV